MIEFNPHSWLLDVSNFAKERRKWNTKMAKKQRDWDELYEIVEKRRVGKTLKLSKKYPKSVQQAVAAALTVAQVRLEVRTSREPALP